MSGANPGEGDLRSVNGKVHSERQRIGARTLLTVCMALSLSTLGFGQEKYRVYLGDKQVGEARISQRLLPGGGKYVELALVLSKDGNTLEARVRSTYGPTGEPVRELLDLTPSGRPPLKQVIATFDAEGANVVVKNNGTPSSLHLPSVPSVTRAMPSEFWFLRDQPRAGDHCHGAAFNIDTLEWEVCDVTFVGPAKGGFLVTSDRSGRRTETIFDRFGLPLSIRDSKGERIVRESQGKTRIP